MLRLGHIEYSNCFPVHAALVDGGPPDDLRLVADTPGNLNRALARGDVDVAPCSSIELARHADRYRILPGLVIGSRGPVGSILLESAAPLQELAGADIMVPTASATSVVLLRVLLERHHGITARFHWFDQGGAGDPVGEGADAALWIGDRALRRTFPPRRLVTDLGSAWTEWTGLPFAFAVWQTSLGPDRDGELRALARRLDASRTWFHRHATELAARHAAAYGMPPAPLLRYWLSLCYDLDAPMRRGLLTFFQHAAAVGEAPPLAALPEVPAGT